MFEQSLIQIGLSYPQAIIYEALVKNGPLKAGKITQKTPFKRGLVYKALEDMLKDDLIEKIEEIGRVAVFQAKHPLSLKDYAEQRERKAKDARMALEGMISSIVSEYNLSSGKPGILFYEGIEGVKKAMWDTLTSKELIYAYADVTLVDKHIKKINEAYVKQRNALKIKKRLLYSDSLEARERLRKLREGTDARIVEKLPHLGASIQVYDNKVCYITLTDENKIGVIIEDENIYKTHKTLFESMWNFAKPIDQLSSFSNTQ